MVRQTRIVNEQLAMELANVLPRKFQGIECQPVRPYNSAVLWRVFIKGDYIPDSVFPFIDGYLAGRAVESPVVTQVV